MAPTAPAPTVGASGTAASAPPSTPASSGLAAPAGGETFGYPSAATIPPKECGPTLTEGSGAKAPASDIAAAASAAALAADDRQAQSEAPRRGRRSRSRGYRDEYMTMDDGPVRTGAASTLNSLAYGTGIGPGRRSARVLGDAGQGAGHRRQPG